MDETRAKKLFYGLNFISKFLLVVFWIILMFHPFTSVCDPFRFEHPLTCFGFDFGSFFLIYVPLSFLPLSVIIQLSALYFAKTKKLDLNWKKAGKDFSVWFLILLIVGIFFGMVFVPMCGSRYKARNARRMSDLRQIRSAQVLYYQKYSRYADTQKELIDSGMIKIVFTDPSTQIEYTDKDGLGIEGGDSDPQTWEAQTYLERPAKEVCDQSSLKKTQGNYICNEKGCGF